MTGAFQFYALKKELVDSGKMTYRQYHDAVLQENSMPIEMLRATSWPTKSSQKISRPRGNFIDLRPNKALSRYHKRDTLSQGGYKNSSRYLFRIWVRAHGSMFHRTNCTPVVFIPEYKREDEPEN